MEFGLISLKFLAALVVIFVGIYVVFGFVGRKIEGGISGILGLVGVGESRARLAKSIAGALMLGFVAWWWFWPADKVAGKVQPAALVVSGPVVAEKQAPADCSCASGATCTGPRGGQYCLTEGGNKKYK